MTVHEEIIEAVAGRWDMDPHDLAEEILSSGLSRYALIHALASLLLTMQRQHARQVEEAVFRAAAGSNATSPVAFDAAVGRLDDLRSQFAPLFKTTIAIGDGVTVTWGRATVEQHWARIAMLEAKIDGLTEAVDRHKQAISMITSAGVTCLEELGQRKPARRKLAADSA